MGLMATPPVEMSEVLYRQVGPGGNPIYFDPTRTRPIHSALFLPSPNDTDGLSLIRAGHRTRIWSASRPESPTIRYRLVCITASDVARHARTIGFADVNFDLNPDTLDQRFGEPQAHCVVREINRTTYDKDAQAKRRIKEWALAMSSHISQADVIGPFAGPTDADPYRPAAGNEANDNPTSQKTESLWRRTQACFISLWRAIMGG